LRDEFSLGSELLDAVVPGVGDEDILYCSKPFSFFKKKKPF